MTLEEFDKQGENTEGYYVVWHSGFVDTQKHGRVWGISSCIVEYDEYKGFKEVNSEYPDWLDDKDPRDINIQLFQRSPSVDELGH